MGMLLIDEREKKFKHWDKWQLFELTLLICSGLVPGKQHYIMYTDIRHFLQLCHNAFCMNEDISVLYYCEASALVYILDTHSSISKAGLGHS